MEICPTLYLGNIKRSEVMNMNVEEKVVSIIRKVSSGLPNDYKSLDLIKGGILDSLAIMQMIGELDDAFDIELDVDDVVVENFNSIQHIVDLVNRYL